MRNLLSIPYSNRIFGLDLLRALAILSVMVSHSGIFMSVALRPYYTLLIPDGVTLFFVLSGFLIGGILIRTLESKPPTSPVLLGFWVKRWFRTVPLYLLILLINLGITATRSPDFHLSQYTRYFFFLQNFNWPMPDFFAESWSLTCEEAFYLFIPPAIFLLARRISPKSAVAIVAGLVLVLATLYRYWKFVHMPPHTTAEWDKQLRSIVLTRADAIIYGVLAAYCAHYVPSIWWRYRKVYFVAGLALFALHSSVSTAPDTLYTSVFSFSVTALSSLLLLPFLSEWRTARGYLARAITHTSLISYSLYLVHGSIIIWAIIMPHAYLLPGSDKVKHATEFFAFWGLSFLIATISYKYFELPFIKLRTWVKSVLLQRKILRWPNKIGGLK